MFDIKLCVCTFHNGFNLKEVGGLSSGPVYLADQLKLYFNTVDLVTLRHVKNSFSPIAAHAIYQSNPKALEEYDFVVFSGPGLACEKYDENTPDKYINVLDHTKKFTFVCNDENDRTLYPYYKNFLTHPNMTFVTFNTPYMAQNTFTDFLEMIPSGDWDYINFSPLMPSKEVILEKAHHKENKVMSTCRWTTSKRIYEYLSIAEEFVKRGIQVFTAGAHSSYWDTLRMEEIPKEFYTDLGYFEPSQIPELLKDVKYHWNFLFQLRRLGKKTHQPRLEIATMEALREGCLPIICKEFTPDWVGEDSAVRVSKDDYTKIPQILFEMSEEERLNRISLLYDRVQEALRQYEVYSNHIVKCLSEG